MPKHIQINQCRFSDRALGIISDFQEDNNHGFAQTKEHLSEMLIVMIQEGFGDDKRNDYINTMADVIDLINELHG